MSTICRRATTCCSCSTGGRALARQDRAGEHFRKPGDPARLHLDDRRQRGRAIHGFVQRDETLVGVYGNSAGTYVNRVGLHCVQFDQAGAGSAIRSTAARPAATAPPIRRPARAISRSAGSAALLAVRRSARLPVPGADLRRQGHRHGAVSRRGGWHGRHGAGAVQLLDQQPGLPADGRSGAAIDAFGMLCREAPITQVEINTPPSVTNPGNQVEHVGARRQSADCRDRSRRPPDTLTFSATGLAARTGISTTPA